MSDEELALEVPTGHFLAPPKNMEEALDLATMLSKSSIVPRDLQGKPGDILVAIEFGMSLGLKWIQAVQNVAVINGRPTIWGDALKAVVMSNPLCTFIEEDELEVVTAKGRGRCKVGRKGKPDVEVTFSIEDAKKAHLWGKQGPWTQYPARMLMMRARSFALRDAFPDALKGIICREEAEDIAPAIELPPAEAPRRSRRQRTIDAQPSESTGKPLTDSSSASGAPATSGTEAAKSKSSEPSHTSSSAASPESSSSGKPSAAPAAATASSTPEHPEDFPVYAKVVSRNKKTSKSGSVYVVLTLKDEEGRETLATSYEKDVVEKSEALHTSGELGKFMVYKQAEWTKIRSIEDPAAGAPQAAHEEEPPA